MYSLLFGLIWDNNRTEKYRARETYGIILIDYNLRDVVIALQKK